MALTIFDLVRTSAEMELMGPDDAPTGVKLRLQSLNTASLKQKAVEAQAAVQHANKSNNIEEFAKLLNRAEKSVAEMAGLAIVGWDNDEMMGGPYTPEYAKQICAMPQMDYLRKQVTVFIADQQNFFAAPELGLKTA